jgi:chitodextrinase
MYQPLYSEIDTAVSSFATTVDASWNGVPHPVDFAAELGSASGVLGKTLLAPDHYSGVLLELDSLKAMGVKAVNVQLAFPVLYPGYYSSPAEHQKYVDFYKRVAADIRTRGLKMIGRFGIVLTLQGFSTVDTAAYFRSLTFDQYKAGRIETIITVLQQIRPDYITILNEPDVESMQSAKPELSSVSGSTDFLRAIIAAVKGTGIPGIKIGAGMGTWSARYEEFVQSFLATDIDFLDLHVYPTQRDFLPRLIRAAELAETAGKGLGLGEIWAQKVSDAEMGAAPVQMVFARDPFSFWAPLDEKFLRTLIRFAHYKKLLLISPLWSQYLHAYIDYDAAFASLPSAEIAAKSDAVTVQATLDGKFSSTGVAFARAIAVTPDVTAPGTPTGLMAYSLSNNAIHLSWAAATDNVGVAGYKVYRDGNLVGTTATLYWQDIGLTPTTTYAYTIAAYDVVGNTSAAAAVTGRTSSVADTTPPSVPGPVAGAPLSTAQIRLAWGRSTDNVVVVGYRIFRNGMQIAQVSTTAYSDAGLQPGTTYSYAVAAVDNSGNVSARSAATDIATIPRDTQPPSAPTDFAALAGRDIVYLSWTPSSDNVAVVAYHIFRNNVRIAVSSIFAYQDTTVKGSTTYTYKVLAADANGNISGFSEAATVTTPDTVPPTVPGAPAGEALSTTQIKLSWPAAIDNVKIAGYRILRNGSFVGNSILTQYVDRGLAASTTYSYTVVAVDTMGNESAPSAACSVTTQAPDTQAPSAPAITVIIPRSVSQVDLGWSTSTDNARVAGYYVYRDAVKVGTTVGTFFADTGLSADTEYTYTVRAFDSSGQMSAPAAPRTVTTPPPPDTTPPARPAAPSVYVVSPTQLLLVWPVSSDNNRVAGYRIYRNGVNVTSTIFPAWMDTNLSPATTYQYAVVAVDAAGNVSPPSPIATGTTLPPPDRTPPSVPTAVKATALASNRVSITWTASTDNVKTAGYKIFRNGNLIAVTLASPFIDVLALPNTSYAYTVAAFDGVGNTSAQSAAALVKTPH